MFVSGSKGIDQALEVKKEAEGVEEKVNALVKGTLQTLQVLQQIVDDLRAGKYGGAYQRYYTLITKEVNITTLILPFLGLAHSLKSQGDALFKKKAFEEAHRTFTQTLDLYQAVTLAPTKHVEEELVKNMSQCKIDASKSKKIVEKSLLLTVGDISSLDEFVQALDKYMQELKEAIEDLKEGRYGNAYERQNRVISQAVKPFELTACFFRLANSSYAQGMKLFAKKQYSEALTLFYQAKEIYEEEVSMGSLLSEEVEKSKAELWMRIGLCCFETKAYEAAIEAIHEALPRIESIQGSASGLITPLLYKLSFSYAFTGNYKECILHFKTASELSKKKLGEDHIGIARNYVLLGRLLMDQEHYAEALATFLDAFPTFKKHLKHNDGEYKNLVKTIGECNKKLRSQ